MAEFVKLEGLKQLDKRLATLDKKLGFKALRSGMMQASKPMFAAAKANAGSTGIRNRDSGAIQAAMGRWTKKITPTRTVLYLGPKNKAKKAVDLWNRANESDATRLNHFHLVEFGSIHGGAQPFLRPAFDSTKLILARSFGRELSKAIDKFTRLTSGVA